MSGTNETSKSRTPISILFDLRTIIGFLFGVYGIVCLIWGIVSFTSSDAQKSGGININLWAGIGMIIVSGIFLIWSLRRPLQIGESDADPDQSTPAADKPPADEGT